MVSKCLKDIGMAADAAFIPVAEGLQRLQQAGFVTIDHDFAVSYRKPGLHGIMYVSKDGLIDGRRIRKLERESLGR